MRGGWRLEAGGFWRRESHPLNAAISQAEEQGWEVERVCHVTVVCTASVHFIRARIKIYIHLEVTVCKTRKQDEKS